MSKKIAVIGGVTHGRTTLVAAIERIFGDEVEHPIDIDFADSKTEVTFRYGGEEYTFFDFPETEDYAENLDGTEDCAVWVIDACEGPLGGAREQLGICIEKGIENYVLFTNKCDLMDDEDLVDICEMENKEVFDEEGIFSDDVPAVRGSARKAILDPESEDGDCIRELVYIVDSLF